jgi:hypothetical protein
MRTTLTIDPDIAVKAKKAVQLTGMPFKSLINQALRIGIDAVLSPKKSRPYRTEGRPMRLRKGLSYDNIQELLSVAEGEDFR